MKAKIKDNHPPQVELRADGWQRFELAVDAAIKGGPKHNASAGRLAKKTKRSARRLSSQDR